MIENSKFSQYPVVTTRKFKNIAVAKKTEKTNSYFPRKAMLFTKHKNKMLQPQIFFLSRINAPAKRFGHSLTNQLAERINSFFLSRTIFSSPYFGVSTVREPWASSTNRPLSLHCYWFHLEPHRWRTRCCQLHTRFLQTKDQHKHQRHKRDTFSLLLLYTCYDNKPFFVVLFKRSFVIHLYCQITYSVREINHTPKH